MRSRAVAWWHRLLRAISALNVALWSLSAVAVVRECASIHAGIDAACYLQLLLSGVYVAGCAFRCFLPVIDIPRLVLVDSRFSSVLVGRSVATVAELCFAAQWALMMHASASSGGSPFVQAVSLAIVPLIVLAEGFSWYAVLTTEQRPHAVENSLWGLSAALIVACMLVIGPHRLPALYPGVIAGGVLYVAFIFAYDVPMYRARWRLDQAKGRKYLSVSEGWVDVCRRWTVSYRWEDWKDEVAWMSLYFTFGVWSSIWLVYASLPSPHPR
ncbi:MAG TPA: hypothetical protein VEU78_02130 [Steroidobacteraceae bacterium]|nr:hypothetical protein [Steroidobacteraceae bacterium]